MSTPPSAARAIVALIAGAAFGLGLGIAQMTNPLKVLSFLDVAGAWDVSLLFVLGAAVVIATLGYRFVLKRRAPVFDDRFHLASSKAVDGSLITGSVLFGIGWGLAGYCPGPAIASLGFANPEAVWVVPAMFAGAALRRWQVRRRDASLTAQADPA